ncbi:MAG: TonB-dependent receptor [Candidatus Solibacter sp.]|jgi:hypothetical protein
MKKSRLERLTRLSLLFVVFLQFSAWRPLSAQTGAGTIEGTVKDQTGAIIPGAKVRVVHVATSEARGTTANAVGFYTFPQVPIGNYHVTVQSPGMVTWQGELQVMTGQVSTVDAALTVGSSSTEVTISGSATSLVTDSSPTVGAVLENARIQQLPLNGRSLITMLGSTVPGAESDRINGLVESAFELVQDGALVKNLDTGSPEGLPGLDSVDEFRVETSVSSAKFDRPSTAIISTKSGSNTVHGSVFETARNSGIGVARRRQDTFTKAPHLVRNEFGASVGGPVWLPKIYNGKNKTFFFVAYEGLRTRQGTTAPAEVFPAAWEQGNFSGLTNSSGQALTLYNPYSTQSAANNWARTPFPNNQIPVSLESPLAKYIYSVTPLPTMANVNPLVANNFFGLAINSATNDTTTARVDQSISERDRIFGRFSRTAGFTAQPPTSSVGPPTTDLSTNLTYRNTFAERAAAGWTHTFSPTFFGETTLSTSWENYNIYTGDYFKDWSDQLGLPNPLAAQGFPNITSTGSSVTFIQGDTRRQNKALTYTVDQGFTKVVGHHELQFGGRFRSDNANVLPDQQYPSGAYDFASGATGLYDPTSGSSYSAKPQTDYSGADFFLGIANYYRVQLNPKSYHLSTQEYAGYFQDNWKIRPRLTLNLGIRYEYNPPLRDKIGLLQGFDLNNMAIVDQIGLDQLYQAQRTTPSVVSDFTNIGVKFETPNQAGQSSGLINPYKVNFGPRAGFAWRATGDRHPLVIRGGLGIYDYSPPLRDFDASTRSNPPFNATFQQSFTSASQSPDGLPNYALRSVPSVVAGVSSSNVVNLNAPGLITPGSFTVVYFDPNYPDTRVSEWNFSMEKELKLSTVVSARYVGNHGWNLNQDHYMNQAPSSYIWYVTTGLPLPTGTYASTATRNLNQTVYGNLEEYGKTGWSNSNSLEFQVEHRYSKGVAFQLYYTLDNAFRAGGMGWHDDIVQDPNVFLPGAVPTDFDARNRFLYYQRDTAIPKHRVRWNWLVDLPVGRGKKLAQNAGPWMNRLIGGWQISGFGTWRSNYFSLPTTNYGTFGPVQVYGLKYPVQDCRSGSCIPGYLYWNGYIQANQINQTNAAGQCIGICGIPSSYTPSNQPIIPWPANPSTSDPNYAYYGTNTVYVPLKNGTVQRISISPNLHPWQNQYVMGPGTFGMDASLVKNVAIKEHVMFRLQADFFSVLNNPGLNQPGSNGIISMQTSANAARVMQLIGRLTW